MKKDKNKSGIFKQVNEEPIVYGDELDVDLIEEFLKVLSAKESKKNPWYVCRNGVWYNINNMEELGNLLKANKDENKS